MKIIVVVAALFSLFWRKENNAVVMAEVEKDVISRSDADACMLTSEELKPNPSIYLFAGCNGFF